MPNALPTLHEEDLALELKEYLSHDRAHFHFAFHGTRPTPSEIQVEGHGAYRVEPVRCELELRERFASLEELPRVAWLVPFAGHVPHDLRHRFAKDGTVRTVGALSRVRRVFDVQAVEAGLDSGPLAQWLTQHDVADPSRLAVRTQRLTASAMWSAWFAAETRIGGLSDLTIGEWLLRCATNGAGPTFMGKLAASELGVRVRDALTRHISGTLGALGVTALETWGRGAGAGLLRLAIVTSALRGVAQDGAELWLTMKLDALGVPSSDAMLAELSSAGDQALHELSRAEGNRAELIGMLRAAEEIVDKPKVRAQLSRHTWLPIGFRARLDALGARIDEALAAPTVETFQRAVEADAALAQHHHYTELGKDDADRARMAVRLLGFLVRSDAWVRELPAGDLEASQWLARWYAQEGGYVDLARHALRTGADTPFALAVRKLVDEVDALRRKLDRRFAQGLAQWLGAGTPAGQMLPIQHALGQMLEDALGGKTERRALVLLMDGMGWADCIAILRSAAETSDPYRPLVLNSERRGSPHGVPVIAAIPTVTKVSRSAFFEGQLPSPGREPSSSDDPRRFAAHPAVTKFNEGRAGRLMLRAEGHHADGELSPEGRALIADAEQRVVGLVVNAIDASLKSDAQQLHQWTVNSIRSLPAILDEARRADRLVLFASDHGHVRSTETMKAALPDGAVLGGERWRGTAAGEAHGMLHADRPGAPLAIQCKSVWTPPGAQGVAVLTDERGRHTHQPHAGEHGGATLAEVVAPCLWLGPASGEPADPGLDTEAMVVPDWWLLRPPGATSEPTSGRASPTLPGVDTGRRARKDSQAARRRPSQPALGALASALLTNELFRARARNAQLQSLVLRAVDYLEQREGFASLQDLADAVGEPFYRMHGVVSRMQTVLNVEGEPILERPPEGNQIRLNVAALRQQFEVQR